MIKPAVNQVEHHPHCQPGTGRDTSSLRKLCVEQGIVLEACASSSHGQFTRCHSHIMIMFALPRDVLSDIVWFCRFTTLPVEERCCSTCGVGTIYGSHETNDPSTAGARMTYCIDSIVEFCLVAG